MAKSEDFEEKNSAVLDSFRRKFQRNEEEGEHAEKSLKAYLKQELGPMGSDKRKSVARDIIKVSQGEPSKFRGGEYGSNIKGILDEPLPTGFEQKPWEDEEND